MKAAKRLRRWWRELADAFFPRRCRVCGSLLGSTEEHICLGCYMKLPFTRWHGRRGNGMERIFWAHLPIERANALLHYHGGDESRKAVLALKYYNRPQVGIWFGRIMAADLRETDFFDGIDVIVPVPLARKRQRQRGYNQSEMLARGVSEVTGLPVVGDAVARIKDNPTQTHLTSAERKENVRDIFRISDASRIRQKHVLLIDDVLTTGATLLSCAEELVRAADVRISVLTLFIAGRHGDGPVT